MGTSRGRGVPRTGSVVDGDIAGMDVTKSPPCGAWGHHGDGGPSDPHPVVHGDVMGTRGSPDPGPWWMRTPQGWMSPRAHPMVRGVSQGWGSQCPSPRGAWGHHGDGGPSAPTPRCMGTSWGRGGPQTRVHGGWGHLGHGGP